MSYCDMLRQVAMTSCDAMLRHTCDVTYDEGGLMPGQKELEETP